MARSSSAGIEDWNRSNTVTVRERGDDPRSWEVVFCEERSGCGVGGMDPTSDRTATYSLGKRGTCTGP